MIGWLLLAGFAALSYKYSWWYITVVLVLAIWKLSQWYYYSSRPWRLVHYPMMRAYSTACGLESAQAQSESREFNFNAALVNLLKIVNPEVNITHEELIEREFERCKNFFDESLIQEYLIMVKGMNPNSIQPILKEIQNVMKTSDKGLMVRMIIASIIEMQFSPQDRGEYLFQVFSGNAN